MNQSYGEQAYWGLIDSEPLEETPMPNIDAVVRELEDAHKTCDPAGKHCSKFNSLAITHMPAILAALKAKDEELKAVRAVVEAARKFDGTAQSRYDLNEAVRALDEGSKP